MNFVFRRDFDAEKVINEFAGVSFRVGPVPFSDINWIESANNCARLGNALNGEKIEEYASAFRNGDQFPMVVVERSTSGFIILGGNQRCNAIKTLDIKDLVLECYIVDPLTSANRELIIRSLNSRHGWGSEKSERIEHAVYLVEAKGIATAIAARAMMVSESTITERIRANKARQELVEDGMKEAADTRLFSNAHIEAIARVSNSARRMQIAKAVRDSKVKAADVATLAVNVQNAKSDAQAQKKIAETVKDWMHTSELVTSGPKNNTRRTVFIRKIAEMEKFLESGNQGDAFSTFDELGCSPVDADKLMVSIAKIRARLECIMECAK
jgi:hypothetical protein